MQSEELLPQNRIEPCRILAGAIDGGGKPSRRGGLGQHCLGALDLPAMSRAIRGGHRVRCGRDGGVLQLDQVRKARA